MHGYREAFVFHPHSRKRRKVPFQSGHPSLDLAAGIARSRPGFRSMVADDARHRNAAQFAQQVPPATPGDDDARIQRRQANQRFPGAGAHAGPVRMLDDRGQGAIEIERAERAFLREPGQDRAGSTGQDVMHRQAGELWLERSARRPVTRP